MFKQDLAKRERENSKCHHDLYSVREMLKRPICVPFERGRGSGLGRRRSGSRCKVVVITRERSQLILEQG